MRTTRWHIWALLGAVTALFVAATAHAQPATRADAGAAATHSDTVPGPLATAIERLPALLNGEADAVDLQDYFSSGFLAAVPEAQVRAITQQLRTSYGAAQDIASTETSSDARTATVRVNYASAIVQFSLAVDAQGKIAGLRITDVAARNDSFATLGADLAALPGSTAWGVYRLDADGRATLLHGANTDRDMAVGSTFKLTILGTLDSEIAAGRMAWDDVVPIDRRAPPFSLLNDWPLYAPMTLHSLASLMISRSDNSASDILLHHLGRERVEQFARTQGGLSGLNAFPLLSTLEATILKTHRDTALTARWVAGDERTRRAMLREYSAGWQTTDLQLSRFAEGPLAATTIEWFASADSIARLLGWFDRQASDTALAILSINAGISEAAAAQWAYVGYKGGSEPGVISMSILLRGQNADDAGHYVVTMSWNNAQAVIDESRLPVLLTRAANLLTQR